MGKAFAQFCGLSLALLSIGITTYAGVKTKNTIDTMRDTRDERRLLLPLFMQLIFVFFFFLCSNKSPESVLSLQGNALRTFAWIASFSPIVSIVTQWTSTGTSIGLHTAASIVLTVSQVILIIFTLVHRKRGDISKLSRCVPSLIGLLCLSAFIILIVARASGRNLNVFLFMALILTAVYFSAAINIFAGLIYMSPTNTSAKALRLIFRVSLSTLLLTVASLVAALFYQKVSTRYPYYFSFIPLYVFLAGCVLLHLSVAVYSCLATPSAPPAVLPKHAVALAPLEEIPIGINVDPYPAPQYPAPTSRPFAPLSAPRPQLSGYETFDC